MGWEAGEEGAASELWVTSWSGDGEDRRFRLRDGVFRPVADSAAPSSHFPSSPP